MSETSEVTPTPDATPVSDQVTVTVYPMTGRQLGFNVPHRVCEECDLTVRLVQRVTEDHPNVELRIKPWFNHLFDALRRGGWHPPVVTINGKIATQGILPDEARFRRALDRASEVTSTSAR